jgi:hypothetical protein
LRSSPEIVHRRPRYLRALPSAASVTALITIVTQTIQLLTSIQDAPRNIHNAINEANAVSDVLIKVQTVCNRSPSGAEFVRAPLSEIQASLKELQELLKEGGFLKGEFGLGKRLKYMVQQSRFAQIENSGTAEDNAHGEHKTRVSSI